MGPWRWARLEKPSGYTSLVLTKNWRPGKTEEHTIENRKMISFIHSGLVKPKAAVCSTGADLGILQNPRDLPFLLLVLESHPCPSPLFLLTESSGSKKQSSQRALFGFPCLPMSSITLLQERVGRGIRGKGQNRGHPKGNEKKANDKPCKKNVL